MNSEHDDLDKFRDDYLDYLENARDEPPALDGLTEEQRLTAESFIASIRATRGVDPYASRPSIEQLLASRPATVDRIHELGEGLQNHLRHTVDRRAVVAPDAASTADGLASVFLIQALGMRVRVVPETTSSDLNSGLTERAEDIDRVFSAFPDSHAVLYTTMEPKPRAVVLDRGDVQGAIETPSGKMSAPRLRRSVFDAGTACELWLRSLIPEFKPLDTDLFESTSATESALDTYRLASMAVDQVSAAGARAKIEAKRVTWGNFGDREAERLASILREAQRREMSEEEYRSHLNELIEKAA